MSREIRMPQIDAETTEADLVAWLARPGDSVEQGDVLLEIETEKTTVEIEAPATGVLLEILVPAGSTGVAVGTLLGTLDAAIPEATPDEAVSATALARRVAEQAGLDLKTIAGTGPRGRITRDDVELQRATGREEPSAEATPVPPQESRTVSTETERAPLSRTPNDIPLPSRMTGHDLACVHLSAKCRIDGLIGIRERLCTNNGPIQISLEDLIVRAAARALLEMPQANASLDGNVIVMRESVDVAISVSADTGISMPVIVDADEKGIVQLAAERQNLVERAHEGQLSQEDCRADVFGVINLAIQGIDSIYPSLKPPRSCLLGLGSATREPVEEEGQIVVGTTLAVTLSTDPRVVDEALGAKLLALIRRHIEHPLQMLL